ncbi:glycosyltransferase family A protein [Natronoflexus pectinivorans]|uniref:Glycosyl transferase family 2 n=1 Tax=Natronoflexus pectinivorans TaxID=682526 RepID=A0A4V2RW51_9BACT|nr:glycosyltransferase family 2 protein [Natronoflexus pectinivorans]TCO06854.1 glycosyl transferase family 2 [Natronoflexus pectinivorans]
MRIGVNPQKSNIQELSHKRHRVILPFWIPNVIDSYFKNQPEVLHWCLKSLTETINPETTAITLINNNSCDEASQIAESFVKKGVIDKYVVLNENRGKLEAIISEARASYEEYITFSDADFLFYSGWEDAVIDVFNNFLRAGVVTCYPCPHLTFHYNSAWIWSRKRQCGKVVADEDLEMVEMGFGNEKGAGVFSGLGIKRDVEWREMQYFLNNDGNNACVGATHALATMKRDIIKNFPDKKVKYVFKNGYEHDYIDFVPERLGYYRLSTTRCLAYHLGNSVPDEVVSNHKVAERTQKSFPEYKPRCIFLNRLLYYILNPAVRFVRKYRLI